MSLVELARISGMSTSTVWRVMNNDPRVSQRTAKLVREIASRMDFNPVRRNTRNGHAAAPRGSRTYNVAFLVLGTSGVRTAPAFERLLRGVSNAADEHNLVLSFSFVSDPSRLPANIREKRVDGLLLHGVLPAGPLRKQLKTLPTVWLMANARRPNWGDQVMQDNSVVGELAAKHLLERGHTHLACVSVRCDSWGFKVRAFAFQRTVADAAGSAPLLEGDVEASRDYWHPHETRPAFDELVDRLLNLRPRPTGLFVVEDRQLTGLHAALAARGLTLGPHGDFDVVSCNNEHAYLMAVSPPPASIDLRVESIGRRGVEQLLWRLQHDTPVPERIRLLIEPCLPAPVQGERSSPSPSNQDDFPGPCRSVLPVSS